jgi:N-acyl-D-amino-acid deacylase
MNSMLFNGATVVDGTGEPRYEADVLVRAGRIAAIARPGSLPATVLQSEAGARRVDARGRILSPGFIDMHAHSDLALLADSSHVAKLSQGVTTEVIGQDGIAYAPVDDITMHQVRRQIAGWDGNPPSLDYSWRSVEDYLTLLERGIATNAAVLVPQGNLRMLTIGQDDRMATADEVAAMRDMLRDALAAGAVGLSSGLTYTPGMYADTAELESLCAVVAEYGGYYCPHTRSYGAGALDAFAEVIGIARRTGCALHLAHATLNFATNRDAAAPFLAMLDAARNDGVDVTLDTYPYLPGATTLAALLPSWFAAGGPDAMLARLAARRDRDALAESLKAGADGFHGEPADWSLIEIAGVASAQLEHYVGSTIAQIAEAEGRDALDVIAEILVEDELATSVLMHIGHEHNVQAVMRDSGHCGGSDGILVGTKPHPRAWGTFPRYLARYVRELGILSLEECVRHLACTPARRLSLKDRGLVREGFAADLVLFDETTVQDTATFDHPRRQASGIDMVLVNGRVAYEDGRTTDARSGTALRSQHAQYSKAERK